MLSDDFGVVDGCGEGIVAVIDRVWLFLVFLWVSGPCLAADEKCRRWEGRERKLNPRLDLC